MKARTIISFLLVMILCACGNTKNEETIPVAIQERPKNFQLVAKVTAEMDDAMTMYYTIDNSIDFNEDYAIWIPTKGSTAAIEVPFVIKAEQMVPTNIRLDFGREAQQKKVVLHEIKLIYGEQSFVIKGSDFFAYFYNSNAVDTKVEVNDGTITFYQKPNQFTVASYYSLPSLAEQLAKFN